MKRCGSSSGSDRPRDLQPPPVLSFITLITYLIYLTLVLSCPWLGSAYPSPHLTPPGGDLSTYVILSFLSFFCSLHQSIFSFVCQTKKFDFLRTPPLGLVSHFSLFYLQLPFNSSRLHFSQLASPACFCLLVWPLFFCGRTGESD